MYLLTKTDGAKFYGQLTDIPNTTRVSNFNAARRLLRVKPACRIKAGDTFYDMNNRVHLVAEHGDQFLSGKHLYTHYKLFTMEDYITMVRRDDKTRDPITNLKVTGGTEPPVSLWIAHEMRSTSGDAVGTPIKRQQIITGYALQPTDMLTIHGRKAVVEIVNEQLGIYIAHVKYE